MTIRYANGKIVEGLALVCTRESMRLALRGCRDAVEFTAAPDGTWLSESGEPVEISPHLPHALNSDCLEEFICPPDVMARLLDGLQTGAGLDPAAISAA